MTNFNSDLIKLTPGKVSRNREIETSDKNAAVNRACADDGNVESRTADRLLNTILATVLCVYVRNRFQAFRRRGPMTRT